MSAAKNKHRHGPALKPPAALVRGFNPFFKSRRGLIIHADSLAVLKGIPDRSVNLVFTSPPFGLESKKPGSAMQADYVAWFMPFAKEIHRVLRDDGSFVLVIGGTWKRGSPTRSIYHFKLLLALVEVMDFHLAQECFWFNPAKLPIPAEWVTVRRIRVKDAVEYVWWFSKTTWPKANNSNVLRPYSKAMLQSAKRRIKTTVRPSGLHINESLHSLHAGGSIGPNVIDDQTPSDLLQFGNNGSNEDYTRKCKEAGIWAHPARFPAKLPEFFIKFLTTQGDIVIDPFGGSMTTGSVCEILDRRWIGVDCVEAYVRGATYRFR